ncbi:Pimeloyl-ACP methyl ester carboxylesterase [Actinokineospora alba]|uniref:Pimeloyl-ACP methyl ester carboxylesterase n=1 Tax=Actinokineospora alba TaxID=504798 RepID=A0A1H0N8Q7_9PSEU|nr:alpha/beta fold hydrolase [Actinokineospora alba]TDP68621.1 pimeloyl-ACP methyl ester carboxylesterase [Actinokineospora alba]SDH83021.1 Pimeloyl-ACP methyl ester carboxylesterase [Actinokineospora alba]SDO89038.1 Pimeloyl-ACP methyl ester carboxylesterase [Actinokineospora alba]
MLLDGITARRVPTDRLTVNVLELPDRDGDPVVFLHGNVSSSLFWQTTMLNLPLHLRPIAVDLRGFGDTDPEPVDATRGLSDYADDVLALFSALGIDAAHLVGWSMGGGVAMRVLRDRPTAVRTLTLVNPVSPFGFGATKGVDGELTDAGGVGSGAGGANPEFVRRLAEGDTSADSPFSPRQILRNFYVKPMFEPEHTEIYVASMLSTRTGDDHYPGDATACESWPGAGPGTRGVLNAMAPHHFRIDDLHSVSPKPPVLWVRGADDQIVSDTSMFDLAYLGALGAIPGWPGEETHPPQPMVAQTRAVLDRYSAEGGTYEEVVIADCGHSPHLEKPLEFAAALEAVLTKG